MYSGRLQAHIILGPGILAMASLRAASLWGVFFLDVFTILWFSYSKKEKKKMDIPTFELNHKSEQWWAMPCEAYCTLFSFLLLLIPQRIH